MRNVAIAVGLLFVAGCGTGLPGTNTASVVTLAQARATCIAWDGSSDGAAFVDALILMMEAGRDDGLTEVEFLDVAVPSCDDPFNTDWAGCITCMTEVAAVVWN